MRLTLGRIGWAAAGTLLLISPLMASGSNEETMTKNTPAYNWACAEEASELLQQIRGLSYQLAEDTHFLELQSRWNQLGWQSHALRLNQIRDNVNAMGGRLRELQEIHGMIAPWQQRAVERVTQNAANLAAHTEGAIEYLNEAKGNTWAFPYKNRVGAMSDHAEEIKSTVSLFLDYGKTSDRLKGLESRVEFTGAERRLSMGATLRAF